MGGIVTNVLFFSLQFRAQNPLLLQVTNRRARRLGRAPAQHLGLWPGPEGSGSRLVLQHADRRLRRVPGRRGVGTFRRRTQHQQHRQRPLESPQRLNQRALTLTSTQTNIWRAVRLTSVSHALPWLGNGFHSQCCYLRSISFVFHESNIPCITPVLLIWHLCTRIRAAGKFIGLCDVHNLIYFCWNHNRSPLAYL